MDATVESEKSLAIQAIQCMSQDATLEEIGEELLILAAIRRGEAAADAGRVIAHAEIKRRSAAWTTK